MESYSQLAAGSVLAAHQTVPTGQVRASCFWLCWPSKLWGGNPARYLRDLSDVELNNLKFAADNYMRITAKHKEEYYLPSTLYRNLEEEKLV